MNVILNRLFTMKELNSLVFQGQMPQIKKASTQLGFESENLIKQIQLLYKIIGSTHRNEYFYKNELFNKRVLGTHSLNTTSALRELPIGDSIADFLIINGIAQVFEIKTELDNLDRLSKQLNSYYEAFSFVNVITDSKYLSSVFSDVDPNVGIYIMTKRNTIHTVRKAKECSEFLNSKSIFKILRKPEFEKIVQDCFGALPQTGDSTYYEENYKLFSTLPLRTQQDLLTKTLKNRKLQRFLGKQHLIKECPAELRELVYFSNLSDKEIEHMINNLKV